MLSTSIFISYCYYCNKLSQTEELKTTQNYSLTILEVRSSKSAQLAKLNGYAALASPEAPGTGRFQFLEAVVIVYLLATSLQSVPPLSHHLLSDSDLLGCLMRTVWLPWAHLYSAGSSPHLKVLNLTSEKSLLAPMVTFTDAGDFNIFSVHH